MFKISSKFTHDDSNSSLNRTVFRFLSGFELPGFFCSLYVDFVYGLCFNLLLAVGEPPLCMSCASLFGVKHAVEEARNEIGKGSEYFAMSKSILSVCLVQLLSATTASLNR